MSSLTRGILSQMKNGLLLGLGATVGSAIVYLVVAGSVHIQGNLTVDGVVYSSGGLLPITATLTSANFEGDGVTSSGWSIQNPHPKAVLCDRVSIRVTTRPTTATLVDIDVGTGTNAQGVLSGATLTDNYPFNLYVHTASGTRVSDSNGHAKAFQLDEKDGTTDYVVLRASTGTGNQLAADFHANCYPLE